MFGTDDVCVSGMERLGKTGRKVHIRVCPPETEDVCVLVTSSPAVPTSVVKVR